MKDSLCHIENGVSLCRIDTHAYAWFPWAMMGIGLTALVLVLVVPNRGPRQRLSLSMVGASSILLGLYIHSIMLT
ncbi:hypothetical protein [Gluconacetobacter sp.]|uniref:hypothetical protein n=1 Tax=Gluconacetobacter sp. TaxID=1935994 RepID=UPI0039E74448